MPVIVNTVLNEHQLVLDIVAFVALGDFPRSRLGEKQRGKILASWVSRKMRTIAQFSIRDPDAEGSVGTAAPDDRGLMRRGSAQSGVASSQRIGASSLRHVESLTRMPEIEVPPMPENDNLALRTQSIITMDRKNDETPTNETPRPLVLNTSLDYSPVEQPFTAIQDDQPLQYDRQLSNWDDDQQQYQHPSGNSYGYPDYPSPTNYGPESPESPVEMPRPLGGLRIANRSSSASSDWGTSALKDLNI